MRLSTGQAKVLADLEAKDAALCELEADGVAEDDPRFMEARAEYAECFASLEGAGIPAGEWLLVEQPGKDPIAAAREPEAG